MFHTHNEGIRFIYIDNLIIRLVSQRSYYVFRVRVYQFRCVVENHTRDRIRFQSPINVDAADYFRTTLIDKCHYNCYPLTELYKINHLIRLRVVKLSFFVNKTLTINVLNCTAHIHNTPTGLHFTYIMYLYLHKTPNK